MLAVFAVALWVLVLIAGLAMILRIALVAAMAGAFVLLFTVPLGRRVFALQVPPVSVVAWLACVVLGAIAGLTLWTLWRGGTAQARTNAAASRCTYLRR
jgi:cation-transporting ATPase E